LIDHLSLGHIRYPLKDPFKHLSYGHWVDDQPGTG
jgi:hypothetical protein